MMLPQACQDWDGLGIKDGWVLWLGPLAGGSQDSMLTLPLRCTPPSGSGSPAADGEGQGHEPAATRGRKRGREAGERKQVGPSLLGFLCDPP